jgi:hypothetical protein
MWTGPGGGDQFTCPLCGESGTVQHHRHVRNNRREAIVLALLARVQIGEGPDRAIRAADRYLAALDERHQKEDNDE